MKYSVKTLREAGLQARWSRTRGGAPILMARDPKCERKSWYFVDSGMWARMEKEGVYEAFSACTLLGEFFSIPA